MVTDSRGVLRSPGGESGMVEMAERTTEGLRAAAVHVMSWCENTSVFAILATSTALQMSCKLLLSQA